MRRLMAAFTAVVVTCAVASGQTNVQQQVNPVQSQHVVGGGNANSNSDAVAVATGGTSDSVSISEGGIGWSDSDSAATLYYAPTSISNYESKTPPLSTYPPYLPMWQHGGWGTIKAYFPNGPTTNDRVYERTIDPENDIDVKEIKGILKSLPYSGALEMVGGLFNSVGRLFGAPDKSHHGRGFDIANSLVRDRRPEGKPMLVFIDSYVDPFLLEKEGYAYVGRVSLEGNFKRNWDHVYNAAVAEALPWDVDVLLISGGMKGVSVGTTHSTSGGGGFSQKDYSLSLLPGKSTGITEAKGEAVLSATGYRFCPEMLDRKRIPNSLYDRIRRRPAAAAAAAPQVAPTTGQVAAPATSKATTDPAGSSVAVKEDEYVPAAKPDQQKAGITMTRELYNKVFPAGQTVNNAVIR